MNPQDDPPPRFEDTHPRVARYIQKIFVAGGRFRQPPRGPTIMLPALPPAEVPLGNPWTETCDCCSDEYPLSGIRWTGSQMLCRKCDQNTT